MKTLNIPLEDSEFKKLLKVKKERTWRQVLLDLIETPKKESE